MKKFLFFVTFVLICGNVFGATTYGDGRKTISAAGTAEKIVASTTLFHEATICAETDNTGVIALGGSSVVAALATRRGVPLAAGDCKTYTCSQTYGCGDLSGIYADTTVNGDGVTYSYYMEYAG